MIDEMDGEWMTTIPLKDKQALLRVARALKEWRDFREKFINNPSVPLSDIDAKKKYAFDTLKDVAHLL